LSESNSNRITIIGDGAMATVCALMLHANQHEVTLWSAFPEYARQMSRTRENSKYLPGFSIPTGVRITADANEAFAAPQIIVNAVPCQYLRSVWSKFVKIAPKDAIYVSVTKGIENGTLLRPSQIMRELLGPINMVVLSGPSIAVEVAESLPGTLVAASENPEHARIVQSVFTTPSIRVYTNNDIVGVELAGAMKNVIALAAGMVDGLHAGDNAKAALLTRGLVEITRLGIALGANKETFAGLTGLGDLVTTCISPHGRNRRFGELIGKGFTPEEARQQIQSVVEGVATTQSVVELAKKHNVEMPITESVHAIIFEGKKPLQAIQDLMARGLKGESI
jgi:glycerol-3-phosphate dehydrogenase (NAD(P)+)